MKRFTANGAALLSAGATTDPLALGDNLWLHVKVYSTGGENGLHYHPREDHAFFVLQGQATFYDENGQATVVGRNDGVMLPKGTRYRFHSSDRENLVLLRAGGGQRTGSPSDEGTPEYPGPMYERMGADGQPLPGDSPENKTPSMPPARIPGAFFGA